MPPLCTKASCISVTSAGYRPSTWLPFHDSWNPWGSRWIYGRGDWSIDVVACGGSSWPRCFFCGVDGAPVMSCRGFWDMPHTSRGSLPTPAFSFWDSLSVRRCRTCLPPIFTSLHPTGALDLRSAHRFGRDRPQSWLRQHRLHGRLLWLSDVSYGDRGQF